MAATPTQPDLRLHKQLSLIMGERHCTSSNVTSIVFSADLPTIRCRCGELFDSFHCQRCRDDGNPGRTDIHDVAKHEAVKMFVSAADAFRSPAQHARPRQRPRRHSGGGLQRRQRAPDGSASERSRNRGSLTASRGLTSKLQCLDAILRDKRRQGGTINHSMTHHPSTFGLPTLN